MNAAILAKAQQPGARFSDDEVTPELSREAGAFIREYEGNFSFLVEVKASVMETRKWQSRSIVRGVLNCMVSEVRRGLAAGATQQETTTPQPIANSTLSVIRDGTYTVMLGSDYRTIRAEAGEFSDGTPVQWIKFLDGPDNTSDYTCCGYIRNGMFRWTKRFANNTGLLAEAVSVLLSAGDDQQAALGKNWAMQSGRCWICARELTTPESLHAGYGPVCAEHYGLPWGERPEPPTAPAPARKVCACSLYGPEACTGACKPVSTDVEVNRPRPKQPTTKLRNPHTSGDELVITDMAIRAATEAAYYEAAGFAGAAGPAVKVRKGRTSRKAKAPSAVLTHPEHVNRTYDEFKAWLEASPSLN